MPHPGYGPHFQERRDCSLCHYPMLRWQSFRMTPERVWVMWQPDEWKLPWHWIIFGGLMLMALAYAPAGSVFFGVGKTTGRLLLPLINAAGLGTMTVTGYLDYRVRLQKRERLQRLLAPDDWVCPNCLHAEHQT